MSKAGFGTSEIGTPGLQQGLGNLYQYGEPTADRFTPDRWSTQFDPNVLETAPPSAGQLTSIFPVGGPGIYGPKGSSVATPNDASVPVTSAFNNHTDSVNLFLFPNVIHSIGWNSAGFQGLNLQNDQDVVAAVDVLLDAPLSDPKFH